MKLAVFSPVFSSIALDEALIEVNRLGLDGLELATGGYPGNDHCYSKRLLYDPEGIERLLTAFYEHDLQISALSCHGNPLHPQREKADEFHSVWRSTVLLAEKLGVDTVNCFSGCPGDSSNSRYPNWVTCSWPEDYSEILHWQWEESVIPYWKEEGAFARDHGVKIAIEMHPGFVVYNTESLLRLRSVAGSNLGCNFDPSHLFWQQADPDTVIRALADNNALYHVHAKDTAFNKEILSVNGVLEIKGADKVSERAWNFRTVGRGHDEGFWREMISTMKDAGYDGFISIEHEDRLTDSKTGLQEAASVLRRCL